MGDNAQNSNLAVPILKSGGASSNSLSPLMDALCEGSSPTMKEIPNEMSPGSSMGQQQMQAKTKSAKDFFFDRPIGEGSFSMVFQAREVETGREFAIKTCDKQLIKKERKVQYVMREKEIMTMLNKNPHPFFVRLYCTFHNTDRLFFVMTLAKNGEILDYLRKLGCFDETVTRFYAAELVLALEHLHRIGIVHRDLKPENILLSEDMHILISDFGSAKIVHNGFTDAPLVLAPETQPAAASTQRRGSFVGTAQYVSPEVLNGQKCSPSCDFWALGCIIYQMLAGLPPFRAANEYLIFQKIIKLDYSFPDGFPAVAKDLVESLLKLSFDERLGSDSTGGISSLKSHPFFTTELNEKGIDVDDWWAKLPTSKPPAILPYLPATDGSEAFHSNYQAPENAQPGLSDAQLTRLMGLDLGSLNPPVPSTQTISSKKGKTGDHLFDMTDEEKRSRLEKQRKDSPFHRFVEGHLVLKSGLVDKRKGLFARRRMLLLTEGPHLYYVDPAHMELKGQIPWSKQLRPEAKNFRIFFVHTTHRTYYLECPSGRAVEWCDAIERVRQFYLDTLPEANAPPKKP